MIGESPKAKVFFFSSFIFLLIFAVVIVYSVWTHSLKGSKEEAHHNSRHNFSNSCCAVSNRGYTKPSPFSITGIWTINKSTEATMALYPSRIASLPQTAIQFPQYPG
jgi:hypothetical protein